MEDLLSAFIALAYGNTIEHIKDWMLERIRGLHQEKYNCKMYGNVR